MLPSRFQLRRVRAADIAEIKIRALEKTGPNSTRPAKFV